MTALLSTRGYLIGAAIAALVGSVWFYGSVRYSAGVRDTTAKFLQADQEGADDVRQTAREILDAIRSDGDLDELLTSTGGLRD